MAKYFSFKELIDSETARYYGLNNLPNSLEIYKNLDYLMSNVLDVARERLGQPIKVNSGYRCDMLNSLVHGELNSQHMKGEAADIIPIHKSDLLRLWKIIIEGDIQFDQAILYRNRGFIHISVKRGGGNRHEILYKIQ